MRWTLGAVLGLVLTGVPMPAARAAADHTNARAVLAGYVERLAAGDLDGAMALRCKAARISRAERSAFLANLHAVERSVGVPLEAVDIAPVAVATMRSVSGAPPIGELGFRLRTETGRSAAMHVVVVRERGREVLCGFAIERPAAVASLDTRIAPTIERPRFTDLRAALADVGEEVTGTPTPVSAFRLSLATKIPPLEVWTTSWTTGTFGGARVVMARYADAATAQRSAAADIVQPRLADATQRFTSAALPGAIGIRHVAAAWTWVQASDIGDQLDVLVSVHDDVRVWIGVSPLSASDDHTRVEQIAAALMH